MLDTSIQTRATNQNAIKKGTNKSPHHQHGLSTRAWACVPLIKSHFNEFVSQTKQLQELAAKRIAQTAGVTQF